MIYSINLKGRQINYDLERKKVKNINLRIRPDMSIHVSADRRVPLKEIVYVLNSKADYIIKALDRYAEIAEHAPKPKEYADGEVFSVWGRNLELKVVKGEKNSIKTDEPFITLTVKNPADINLKKSVTDKWRKEICRERLTKICENIYPAFQKYGIDFPVLKFRYMKSQWGSCQPKKGIITLNTALTEFPEECAEYVIAHEFTHFLQPDHSKKFYDKLSLFMPDWKSRKKLLEKRYICKD